MPDTNAFKVLRAQKPHTDEELELIQGTVFQRAVSEFAPAMYLARQFQYAIYTKGHFSLFKQSIDFLNVWDFGTFDRDSLNYCTTIRLMERVQST